METLKISHEPPKEITLAEPAGSMASRLISMALRGVTLVCRFLLLFVLAREVSPYEVGKYGLFVASVFYALYFVGLDFYAYTTRELIGLGPGHWGKILRGQVTICSVMYMLALPLILLLFSAGWLPWWMFPWFLVLLTIEHVGQEISRLLIAAGRPLASSLVIFLRGASWVLLLIILFYSGMIERNLVSVLILWTLGGFAAVVAGMLSLKRFAISGWTAPVDWMWIKRGLRVAIPLLAATLCLRALFTLDRFFFADWVGLDALAAYALFIGMAGTMVSFLDSGVSVFLYPRLIKHWHARDEVNFRYTTRSLLVQSLLVSLVFIVASYGLLPYITEWLGRNIYRSYAFLYNFFIVAYLLYSLSTAPHFALYAQGRDRAIIVSHVVGLAVFSVSVWGFSHVSLVTAVPLALCSGLLALTLSKLWAYFWLTPPEFRLP